MKQQNLPRPFLNFARNVFLLGGRYHLRNVARKELVEHIDKVKSKVHKKKRVLISDIEHMEHKMHHVIEKEKKLASFNAVEQDELKKLAYNIAALEKEIRKEKGQKQRLLWERENMAAEKEKTGKLKNEEIKELRQTLMALKKSIQGLRENRQWHGREKELGFLEKKISREVDVGEYLAEKS